MAKWKHVISINCIVTCNESLENVSLSIVKLQIFMIPHIKLCCNFYKMQYLERNEENIIDNKQGKHLFSYK